jgi:hypothetical protein
LRTRTGEAQEVLDDARGPLDTDQDLLRAFPPKFQVIRILQEKLRDV